MTGYKSPLMLIGGEWSKGSGKPIEVLNPANEQALCLLPTATPDDVDTALKSAQRGFEVWKNVSAEKRCEILVAGSRLLRQRADDIAVNLTAEQGKPLAQAKGEIFRAASLIEWDANEARRAYGTIVPSDPGQMRYGMRVPVGPVVALTPWNFPVVSPCRKLGGALASGCSIIIKPSEETPYSCYAVVEALIDGGVPADVINLLYGDAAAISAQLISSPITRLISFTGPVPIGKLLAQQAASHMKPVVMELGGHAPVIVTNDVDAAQIARMGVTSKFINAGQICIAPTRFLLQDEIYDTFVKTFVAETEKLKVGDPNDAAINVGPLANPRRMEAMERLIGDAHERGAHVASGGKRIGNQGYFFEPTVLTDIPPDAEVLKTEPFGPVAAMIRFKELDEAINIANSLPYGLASYAFTNSATVSSKLVAEIESGAISINNFVISSADTVFGGVKDSGYGREGGYESLNAFTATKFVTQNLASV